MSNSPAGHVSWPDRFDDAPISSAQERRKHARKKLAFLTAVLVDSQSNTPATVVDLSEGGVGVRSGAPLEQGTRCRLQLSAPDSNQVIDAACELAWNSAPHAGFRFSILTEKSSRQIKEWLTSSEHAAEREPAEPAADNTQQPVLSAVPQGLELAQVSDERLLELALQVCKLANTHGVAVAINDGSGVICRTSLGFAPDVGVRLRPDRGLSGECLRTGEIVVCYDTESDPRVDPEVARILNMRSAVILPIGRHDTPAGLLEVFSSLPQAFDEAAVYALHELVTAFLIAGEKAPIVQREATPEAAQDRPREEPAEARVASHLPQMASFSQREAAPGFVICDVCGHENRESERVCEKCDVPLPAALRYVDLNSPEESEGSGFRAYPTRTERPRPPTGGNHRKKVLLMLLVAALFPAWRVSGRIADIDPALIPLPRMIVEVPTLQKGQKTPAPKSASQKGNSKAKKSAERPKQASSLKEDPTEPEVVLRNFPIQSNAPAKDGDKKPAEKKSNAGTIPEINQPAAESLLAAEAAQAH